MDTLSRRALNPLHLTRPMEHHVSPHMKKIAEVWSITAKVETVLPPELSKPWPQPPSLSLCSDEEAPKKHRCALRKAQTPESDYFKKNERIGTGTHRLVLTGTPAPSRLNIIHFS